MTATDFLVEISTTCQTATFSFNAGIFLPAPSISASYDIDLDPASGSTFSWNRAADIASSTDKCSPRLNEIWDVTQGTELPLDLSIFSFDLESATSSLTIHTQDPALAKVYTLRLKVGYDYGKEPVMSSIDFLVEITRQCKVTLSSDWLIADVVVLADATLRF